MREAKAEAARRGVTLTALVAEALRQGLGVRVPPAGTDVAERLRESMRWFEANRARLLPRYRDRYVAIEGGRVIDHDADFDALARRVFARVGTRPVFMPKVTPGERVVAVPSPRLAED